MPTRADQPATIESPAQKTGGVTHFKAYVVSDVHLNDHSYDSELYLENPRRRHFREFMSRISAEHAAHPDHQLLLVLNGDILDITGSWNSHILPWNPNLVKVEETLFELLGRILDNNRTIVDEWRNILLSDHTEIYYVIGNHDGMLRLFPESENFIRNKIVPENPEAGKKFHFVSALEVPDLGLYIEHGHRFDPYNCGDPKQRYPLGDYINILLVNRFVQRVTEKLTANGYSDKLIRKLLIQLHDIEYLRPMSLVPLWIQTVAERYKSHPENQGKPESIDTIILSVVAELLDTSALGPDSTLGPIIEILTEKLRFPKRLTRMLIYWSLRFPATLPVASFLVSHTMRRTHNNKHQRKMAEKLYREKGYHLITFGHTHGPTVQPLGQDGYYFNTGSWKPVINLFKHLEFDETNLEYLNPNVQFNKIEYSGILMIEKDLTDVDSPPHFSLQTIQSGLA